MPTDDIDKLLAEAGLAQPAKEGATAAAPAKADLSVDDILAQLNSDLPAGGKPPASPKAATAPVVAPAPKATTKPAKPTASNATPPRFPAFETGKPKGDSQSDIGLVENVNVKVQVLLGRAKLTVEEILRLIQGSVVELDKLAGEPLDILVNDKLVAQGEVLVLNENFCIRVTDIIPPEERA
ncbi:MAG: flagellar motor switch protein FliN [Planctomycetes bacterium]|nr:flagellar motor switch protein FliN [Planctomycetota bacterium]